MSLTFEERQELIRYRIERAELTYKEAEDTARLGHWILTVNRLYYTLFYISNALLLDKGMYAKIHAGVIAKISEHFVKSGPLSKEDGRILGSLQTMRCKGDYDDYVEWTESDVMAYFPKVRQLMDKMKGMIHVELK